MWDPLRGPQDSRYSGQVLMRRSHRVSRLPQTRLPASPPALVLIVLHCSEPPPLPLKPCNFTLTPPCSPNLANSILDPMGHPSGRPTSNPQAASTLLYEPTWFLLPPWVAPQNIKQGCPQFVSLPPQMSGGLGLHLLCIYIPPPTSTGQALCKSSLN